MWEAATSQAHRRQYSLQAGQECHLQQQNKSPTQQVGDSEVTNEALPCSALAGKRKRQVPPGRETPFYLHLGRDSEKPEDGYEDDPKCDFRFPFLVFQMLYNEQY